MSSEFFAKKPHEGYLFDCGLISSRGAAVCRRGLQRSTRSWNAARRARTHPRSALPSTGTRFTIESMRRIKQLGVDNVLMGGPKMPWQEADLQATVDKLKTGGLKAGNMMIAGLTTVFTDGRAEHATRRLRTSRAQCAQRARWVYRWSSITGTRTAPSRAITGRGAGRSRADRVQHQQSGEPADTPRRRCALERGTLEEHYLLSAGGDSYLRAIECAPRAAP